jgi:hypothetical protein
MTVLASTGRSNGHAYRDAQVLCGFSGVGRESAVLAERCVISAHHFGTPFSRFWTNPLVQFDAYRQQWEEETKLFSSPIDMAMHPAYQKIIGMGKPAVPLILGELLKRPNHWFWALKAITGVDPVSPDHRGRLKMMTEDWISWGRRNGHIN